MARAGFLDRIGTKLVDLLSEETDDHGHPVARERVSTTEAPPPATPEFLGVQLQAMLKSDPNFIAGRVNLIGLSKIRDRLGPNWEKLSARAHEIARHEIGRRLTPADVYTRHNEFQYLLIFSQLSKEQAQLKCALIAQEVAKRLLGEDAGDDLIEVQTMIGGQGGVPQFEQAADIEALKLQLIGDATIPVFEADTSRATKEEAVAPAQSAPAAQQPTMSPVPTGSASYVDQPADWELGEADGEFNPLERLHLFYRPVWDVKKNAVTAYECTPAWKYPDGHLMFDEADVPNIGKPATLNSLDTAVLRRTVTDLRASLAAGRPLQVVIPVHFDTLAAYAPKIGYAERCFRGIQPDARKYVVFKLVGVPDGAPPMRLAEMCNLLKRHARDVVVFLPRDLRFVGYPEAGVSAIASSCSTSSTSEAGEIRKMEGLIAAAQKAGVGSIIYNVNSLSMATALIGAGATCLVGDSIGAPVENPGGVYRFSVSDFYSQTLKQQRDAGRPMLH